MTNRPPTFCLNTSYESKAVCSRSESVALVVEVRVCASPGAADAANAVDAADAADAVGCVGSVAASLAPRRTV